MTIDITQFFEAFFEEAEELLAEMERLLLAIDLAAPDAEDLDAVFRTAHSVKGGAATFGLDDMAEVTHVLESLLDRIRRGEIRLTSEHLDAFLAAKDVLKMQLDRHRHGAPVDPDPVADVLMMLQALSQAALQTGSLTGLPQGSPIAVATTLPFRPFVGAITPRYRLELPSIAQHEVDALVAELGLLGAVAVELLDDGRHAMQLTTHESADEIISICSFVVDAADLTLLRLPAAADAEHGEVQHSDSQHSDAQQSDAARARREVEQGYGFFDPIAAPPCSDSPAGETETEKDKDKKSTLKSDKMAAPGAESSSIRVSTEKVDQLINLIGELVITQAMIAQRADGLDPVSHERLLGNIGQLTRNTRDLQEAVMSIRMMPMDFVFSRFPRMVRDLAGKLGKKVDFVTNGAATELDKGLIERIVDPLTHLVRNSIDHGIETPDVRRAAGKADAGRLFLSASHQGGNIIVEVSDDGAGLNRERILSKALQQGISVQEGISDEDVWQLIFAPGFSTADTVTDVSGRGVGMDIVKRNITAMGGTVEIRSAKGFGTTISIVLPLTLAILDGMSIRVGEEVYILPLGFVIESLQPAPGDIKEISGNGRVVKVRGEYLPLIALYQMFDITPRFTNPSEGIVVILESDGRRAGLFVDDLVGQQQVVVKNLEANYRKVTGISGATILGDGGVSLILDVAALIRSSRQIAEEIIFS